MTSTLLIAYQDSELGEKVGRVLDRLGREHGYEGVASSMLVRRTRNQREVKLGPVMRVAQEFKTYELIVGPNFPLDSAEGAQIIVHHELLHVRMGHLCPKGEGFGWDVVRLCEERLVERELGRIYGTKAAEVRRKYRAPLKNG